MATDATTAAVADATTTAAATTTQQTTTTDWRESLPADLKADKSLATIKDVGSLAKSYVEAQKLVGGSIRLPKADAKPEERATLVRDLQTKLGLPEKPEGYALTGADGKAVDGPVLKRMLPVFHKAGLLPEQAQMLTGAYLGLEHEQAQADAQAVQAAEKVLREKWGGDFDRRFQIADRFVTEFGGAAREKLVAKGLHNDPDIIEFLANAAEPFAESGRVSGEVTGGMSPQAAQELITAAEANKDHDFWKKSLEEQRRIHQLAWGTKPIQL